MIKRTNIVDIIYVKPGIFLKKYVKFENRFLKSCSNPVRHKMNQQEKYE